MAKSYRHHLYIPSRNQRLNPELYAQVNQVGFFTVCAYRQQSPLVNPSLNNAIIEMLCSERERLGCWVHVYSLMPDHFHLLLSPKEDGRSMLTFVNQFKGKSTRVSWSHGWQGKLWQPRSYDHLVRREESLIEIAEYILYNVVRAGLVEKPEDYPWCGYLDPLPW